MFIAGGLVSSVIFYPHKKKKAPIDKLAYLTTILSFQYHSGIYAAQYKNPPMFEDESQVQLVSLASCPYFKPSAEHVLKSLEEL
jgi:hypothetical protein